MVPWGPLTVTTTDTDTGRTWLPYCCLSKLVRNNPGGLSPDPTLLPHTPDTQMQLWLGGPCLVILFIFYC